MAVIKGGYEIVRRAMLKELMKRGDDGIMLTLPKNEIVDLNTRITMDRLIKAGIDPESLGQGPKGYIRLFPEYI